MKDESLKKSFLCIGIDPGSKSLGYSIGELNLDFDFSLLDSGTLILKGELAERLEIIFDFFNNLFSSYFITHNLNMIIETPFLGKFPNAYFVLGQVRGVLLLAARKNNCYIFDVSPCEVKKTLTSFGFSSKDEVQLYMQNLIGKKSKTLDESDAQGVMLYGLLRLSAHFKA
jgi:crossover junction endodeoxyribonuclease RuvC